MTSDALAILQALFGPVWSLFTSWYLPGTRMTPAELGFMALALSLIIRFLKRVLNTDGGDK